MKHGNLTINTALAAAVLMLTAGALPAHAKVYDLSVDKVIIDTGNFRKEGIGYNGASPGPVLRFKEGENVTITLAAENSNDTGRASLFLIQDGGGLAVTDHTFLANGITEALPGAGTYLIVISQQSDKDLLPGNPFRGDYCLTVDSDSGAAQTLTPTSTVE